MLASVMVGCINTAATMPLDMVKTQLQQASSGFHEGTWPFLIRVVRAHGWGRLYTGWQLRLLQFILHAAFTIPFLEYLEHKWRSLSSTSF